MLGRGPGAGGPRWVRLPGHVAGRAGIGSTSGRELGSGGVRQPGDRQPGDHMAPTNGPQLSHNGHLIPQWEHAI